VDSSGHDRALQGYDLRTSGSLSFTVWGLGHDEIGRSLSPETRRGWCPKTPGDPANARPCPPKKTECSVLQAPPFRPCTNLGTCTCWLFHSVLTPFADDASLVSGFISCQLYRTFLGLATGVSVSDVLLGWTRVSHVPNQPLKSSFIGCVAYSQHVDILCTRTTLMATTLIHGSIRKKKLCSFLQDARRRFPFFLLSISPLQPIVASFSCSSTVRFHSTVHAPLILRLQSINSLLVNGRLEQSSRVFGVGFNRTGGPEISLLFRRRLMAIRLGLLESCHSGTSQRDSAESA
jgi:hypothetical protein